MRSAGRLGIPCAVAVRSSSVCVSTSRSQCCQCLDAGSQSHAQMRISVLSLTEPLARVRCELQLHVANQSTLRLWLHLTP
jgi:hypothetical protein